MPPPTVYTMEHRIGYRSTGGLFAENVLNYQCATTPTNTDPIHLATIFGTAWQTSCQSLLLACMSNLGTVTAYQTRLIGPVGGPTVSTLVDMVGTVSSPPLSDAVSLCIRWLTNVAKKQGRIFVPSVPETFVVNDVLQSVAVTALNNLGGILAGNIDDSDMNTWQLSLYDRKTGTLKLVLGWAIRNIITAMRRRLYPNPYVF